MSSITEQIPITTLATSASTDAPLSPQIFDEGAVGSFVDESDLSSERASLSTGGSTGDKTSQNFLIEVRMWADSIAAELGCFIYDLEFVGLGGQRALRVYVEKDDKAGVSIDDCSNVSRRLSEILEANEDVIPGGAYVLEVSSPGLERVLKESRHFEKAIGKQIAVKSFAPLLQFNPEVPKLGLAKQVQGRLISFETTFDTKMNEAGDNDGANHDRGTTQSVVSLKLELTLDMATPDMSSGTEADAVHPPVINIPFDSVTKAHVVFEFADPSAVKPGSKKGKAKPYAKAAKAPRGAS